MASLIVKLCLVDQIYDFKTTNFPLYAASEMLALTLFAFVKEDEDCFDCFNRCVEIRNYSSYQME